MLGGKKSNSELEECCAFCEFGTLVPGPDGDDTDVICLKKGVVKTTYVCRRFRYDPLKRNPKEKMPLPDFEAVSLDD